MSIQHSVSVRNARCDAWETAIGASPKLELFTGAPPANCAAADAGTKLVSMSLPADAMAAASGGVKVFQGTWSGTGIAAGNAGHYRIKDSAGTTCHEQGTVAVSAADLTVDNINIAIGQVVNVSGFTKTEPGA